MISFKSYLQERKVASKINANRGDVAEVILGAAVTAKFALTPPGSINKKNVEQVLAKVISSKSMQTSRPDNARGTTKLKMILDLKWGYPLKPGNLLVNLVIGILSMIYFNHQSLM